LQFLVFACQAADEAQVIQSTGRLLRASVWILIVLGCALPLLVSLWDTSSTGDLLGAIVGVAVWAALMMFVDMHLQEPGASSTSRVLMASAVFLMVLEWSLVAAFSKLALFALYSPAVIFAAKFPFGIRSLPDFGVALVLTVVCGAQALGLVCVFRWIAGVATRWAIPSSSPRSCLE
jgi:hypothetical protein